MQLTERQQRLYDAINTRDLDVVLRATAGIDAMSITLDSLVVVPLLGEEAQNWWYSAMAPSLLAMSAVDVSPEEKAVGERWSRYHAPNFEVLSSFVVQELRESNGLTFDELVEKTKELALPRPTVEVSQLLAVLLLGLLEEEKVWQASDLLFHAKP